MILFYHVVFILPEATIDTITDVHVEELWTSTVKSIPIISPTIGFVMRSLWNILPAIIYFQQNKISTSMYVSRALIEGLTSTLSSDQFKAIFQKGNWADKQVKKNQQGKCFKNSQWNCLKFWRHCIENESLVYTNWCTLSPSGSFAVFIGRAITQLS